MPTNQQPPSDFLTNFTRKPALLPAGFSLKPGSDSAPPPQTKAQLLFQSQKPSKKNKKDRKKISILDQWVEITVDEHGQTKTALFPSNDDLIDRGQRMSPPPIYVYRRMNFVSHVPPEYHWVTNDAKRRETGGMCIQRMTVDTWLDVIEREQLHPDGHLGITGVGNMPRPKERGGCSCEICTHNAKFFVGV